MWERTLGEQRVRVAVVEGAVAVGHEAFAGQLHGGDLAAR